MHRISRFKEGDAPKSLHTRLQFLRLLMQLFVVHEIPQAFSALMKRKQALIGKVYLVHGCKAPNAKNILQHRPVMRESNNFFFLRHCSFAYKQSSHCFEGGLLISYYRQNYTTGNNCCQKQSLNSDSWNIFFPLKGRETKEKREKISFSFSPQSIKAFVSVINNSVTKQGTRKTKTITVVHYIQYCAYLFCIDIFNLKCIFPSFFFLVV